MHRIKYPDISYRFTKIVLLPFITIPNPLVNGPEFSLSLP